MSVLDGPGEGTWSVFAAKVVEERDEALEEVRQLKAQLENAIAAFHDASRLRAEVQKSRIRAEDELAAVEKLLPRKMYAGDLTTSQNFKSYIAELVEERNRADARCDTLRELADRAAAEQGLAQRRMLEAQAQRDTARREARALRTVIATAGERLKACAWELTEFSYQEMASVLFDLPTTEGHEEDNHSHDAQSG